MRNAKEEGKRRNKSAMQGFGDFHSLYEKPLKAVHSIKEKGLNRPNKNLRFAQRESRNYAERTGWID